MFITCNINDFQFTSYKKNCLDSNPVIWRFFDFGPSWHQITKCKVFSPLVIWENFGLPPAISSILYGQNSWMSKIKESSNYGI